MPYHHKHEQISVRLELEGCVVGREERGGVPVLDQPATVRADATTIGLIELNEQKNTHEHERTKGRPKAQG